MDGVGDDVSHMLIDEGVHGFAPLALHGDQPSSSQYAQMLGDERLAHLQSVDQFVYGSWSFGQLDHDGEAHRC